MYGKEVINATTTNQRVVYETRTKYCAEGNYIFYASTPSRYMCEITTNDNSPVIWQVLTTVEVKPTELKLNPLYDKIYSKGLNTMFASIIPFLSLLYFNVYTVIGECLVLALFLSIRPLLLAEKQVGQWTDAIVQCNTIQQVTVLVFKHSRLLICIDGTLLCCDSANR